MGSVWLKEVETGFHKLIKDTVRTYNSSGQLEPVKVVVLNPEKESSSVTEFPCVSITNTNQVFDKLRYDSKDVMVSKDPETNKAIMEKSAKPYTLHYQIAFWAEYLNDINEMTRCWLEHIPHDTILEVKDTDGITRHCVMHQTNFVNLDSFESRNNRRLLKRVYSYKVWVELDGAIKVEVPIVTDREINNTNRR